MTEQLKPCPFCGGEAEFIGGLPKSGCDRVECTKCWAEVYGDDRDEAIAAWNTRAAPKVKPLVWAGEENDCYLICDFGNHWYEVSVTDTLERPCDYVWKATCEESMGGVDFLGTGTFAEAKALCQSDWERRLGEWLE